MPLQLIQLKPEDEKVCAQALAGKISTLLGEGKKVLWLVCGGSNIRIAAMAMGIISGSDVSGSGVSASGSADLKNLSMTLTDERYGPVGHKDSNWRQLVDAGFAFDKIPAGQTVPLLKGLSLAETVRDYGIEIVRLFAWADHIVGQFGMGPDGHIGGVLPHTIGVANTDVAVGYEAVPFTRISLSLQTMEKINTAYAFVFGPTKKDALTRFGEKGSLDDIPARVLKLIPEVYVYTDQDFPIYT